MKILLVDGESGMIAALAQSLAAHGWADVGTTSSSDEAVDWMNQRGGCDILVCEVFLEPADGLTLRETIQPHLPGLKTIFMSAYDVSGYADRMAGCTFLPKPVTAEVLDAALRQIVSPPVRAVIATPSSPAAAPVAVSARPAVVAVATPRPASVPQVRATPKPAVAAVPVATPRPAVVVSVKVAPQPVAKASPAAKPIPVNVATVRGTVSAMPVAKASPVSVRSSVGGEIELPPDDLVGTVVGNYQIEARIGEGPMGPIYRAKQTNIGRLARFYTLARASAGDPSAIQRFIANASMKAKASHSAIIAVYEAGESNGVYFYSSEYIPSRSLEQLRENGGKLDDATALQVLKIVADALGFFWREKIGHDLISGNAILIGPNNRPRIANIASHQAAERDLATEMKTVGELVLTVLADSPSSQIARDLALQLVDPTMPFGSWAAFSQALAEREPKVVPADAYKLDAQERAAIRMVEESKKRQKRSMLINSLGSLGLLGIALFAIYYAFLRPESASTRAFNKMVEVPAGEFIFQDGQKMTLPKFYIDEYEVTIGQYAEFLDFISKNPTAVAKLEHPEQPKDKSHVPVGWADMKELTPPMPGYYARAKRWGKYQEAALDVNSPVFGVDWFDAYAYAKWKGRRLPTEEEWEKAARGANGAKFPWGNEENPERANTGMDLNSDPKKGGEKDGFKRWNPVDAKKGDKSPFGMMGAGGNVSEWTATYVPSPELGGDKVPVIRGGNWKNPDASVTRRVLKLMDLQQDDALGFRTASDTPPSK